MTPGSADEVERVLKKMRQLGSATSRFRMPAADGSLVEFDSWTVARGDEFTTVMRPLATIG